MAKLSEQVLEEGRQYIRDDNLEALRSWMTCVDRPTREADELLKIRSASLEKTLELFNKVYSKHDPTASTLGALTVGGTLGLIFSIVFLGIIGGLIFLASLF